MKTLTLIMLLGLAAAPALAKPPPGPPPHGPPPKVHAAPAPLIGLGVPSALALGGVLLGANLLRRKPRP